MLYRRVDACVAFVCAPAGLICTNIASEQLKVSFMWSCLLFTDDVNIRSTFTHLTTVEFQYSTHRTPIHCPYCRMVCFLCCPNFRFGRSACYHRPWKWSWMVNTHHIQSFVRLAKKNLDEPPSIPNLKFSYFFSVCFHIRFASSSTGNENISLPSYNFHCHSTTPLNLTLIPQKCAIPRYSSII